MGILQNFLLQLARPFVPKPPAVSASKLSATIASRASSAAPDYEEDFAGTPGRFSAGDFAPGAGGGLSALCESFFVELCSLRSETPPPTASFAAGRVLSSLDIAAQKARQQPGLEQAFRRVRSDLIFFADYALSRAVPGWRSVAEQQLGIVTGEELFCRDAERAVEEGRADEAAVFRVCAGLGFSGSAAVGADRWRRTAEALARLAPVPRPEGLEAANPAPAPSRSGPVRRTSWAAVFFFFLAVLLAALTAWQIARAPLAYRGRMALLRSGADHVE